MRLSLRSTVGLAGILTALAAPSVAWGDSQVRFIHTVPMVGTAELSVDGASVGTAGFGQASNYASAPSGKVRLSVTQGGKPILDATHTLRDGRSYSVVAMAGSPPQLRVYEDDQAKSGVALMRIIHAAPELGKPDLTVDGKVVGKEVPFEAATRYWALPPGDHTLDVTNPQSGKPVIAPKSVPLAAGTASTVLVVGTGGEKVRTVLVNDSGAAPNAAPATGLGGLAPVPGADWALAAIVVLATGIGALGIFRLLIGRSRNFRI